MQIERIGKFNNPYINYSKSKNNTVNFNIYNFEKSPYQSDSVSFSGIYPNKLSDRRYYKLKADITNKLSELYDNNAGEQENILLFLNKTNIKLANELLDNPDFPKSKILGILETVNENNIELAEKLCTDENFPKSVFELTSSNQENKKLWNIHNNFIADILRETNETNIKLANIICTDKNFPKNKIYPTLLYSNKSNIKLAEKICSDRKFPKEYATEIIRNTNDENKNLAVDLCSREDFPKPEIYSILAETNKNNINFAHELCNNSNIPTNFIKVILATGEKKYNINLETFLTQYKNITSHPEKYITGDCIDNDFAMTEINKRYYIDSRILYNLSKSLDKEGFDYLMRRRINCGIAATLANRCSVDSYINKCANFNRNDYRILKLLCNSTNQYGKPFLPQQKLEMIDLISMYKYCKIDKKNLLPQNGKINLAQKKILLNENILKHLGISQNEIKNIEQNKFLLFDNDYTHLLANEVISDKNPALNELLKAYLKYDFKDFILGTNNAYGKINFQTQKTYEKFNMNYEKWLNITDEIDVDFNYSDANTKKLDEISKDFTEYVELLRSGEAKDFVNKHLQKYIINDEFTIPNEIKNDSKELLNYAKEIEIRLNKVWKRAEENVKSSDQRTRSRAINTLTLRGLLKEQIEKYNTVNQENRNKNIKYKIKMWDREPYKDIFQGNYSNCCIAIGDGNSTSMPQYLFNTAFNMIEIINEETNQTVGNALCYFVYGIDGKPRFVLDNVEIRNGENASDDIRLKLREGIINFAKTVANEVTNKKDTEIILGTRANKIPVKDLSAKHEIFNILGNINCHEIYLDLYAGRIVPNRQNTYASSCFFYKLA